MSLAKRRYTIMDIDEIELLIEEVEKRKPLYDTNSPSYHNRQLKKALWQEICATLSDRWAFFTPQEKIKYGVEIHKRWNSLRDCFRRELNHQQNVRKGGAKRKAKYRFFEKLEFLLPHTQLTSNSSLPEKATPLRTRSSFTRNTLSIDKFPPSLAQPQPVKEIPSTRVKPPSIPETSPAQEKYLSIPENPPSVRETRSARVKSLSLRETPFPRVKSPSLRESSFPRVKSLYIPIKSPSKCVKSLLISDRFSFMLNNSSTPAESSPNETKSPSIRDKSPSLRDKSSLIRDITFKSAKSAKLLERDMPDESSAIQVKSPIPDTDNSDEDPPRKKIKCRTNYDDADDELLAVSKKGNRLTNASYEKESDSDELFLMSLKPFFKDLSEEENMSLRIGIMQSVLRLNMSRTST